MIKEMESPMFGVPQPQTAGAKGFYSKSMYDQGGNRLQTTQPFAQQHSPLGSLAAFKGKYK